MRTVLEGPSADPTGCGETPEGSEAERSDHVGGRGSEAEVLSVVERSDHVGVRGSEAEVLSAIARVDDPEYPGISIVDLGLLESVAIDGSTVRIGLIPTFSGCPALAMIADDVRRAVLTVPGVEEVDVTWLRTPVWTVDRTTPSARAHMATEFTVAVRIGGAEPECPRCGGTTAHTSHFGPSRCRSVSRCTDCGETIEVMRS